MNFDVGAQVGDYEVVGILGAGGMGKVYKVRNVISDRVEAMKVLLPDLAHEPDLADRFLREIKVQASLEHPNIASLHTALRVDNQLLMLMEFVEGQSLEQRLKQGTLSVAEAANYIGQVLAALGYAHERGVIHRDIKPANMMLMPGGVVKLMDFGIAKSAVDRRLTMTGTTMGSLYYMSPEQIKGLPTLDLRSDLYSIGVSLYELTTGKRPFDGDSHFSIMAAHLEKNPIPPIQLDPKLPQTLNDVILMSVAKDPAARFQSAGAFRNALQNVSVPTLTMPAPPAAEKPPYVQPLPVAQAKGNRGLWMAVGATAAALGVIAFIEFSPKDDANAAKQLPAVAGSITPSVQTPGASLPPVQEPAPPATAVQTPVPGPVVKPAARPTLSQVAPPQVAPPIANQPAQAAQAQPVQQPPIQQSPPSSAAPVPSPAVDTAARAALQEVKEQLILLTTRAEGIRGTLNSLQRSLSAKGQNVGAALQGPADLMNQFLQASDDALRTGDLAAAKNAMKRAEDQVEILEKRLGR